MKQIIALLMCVCMLVCLAACGKQDPTNSSEEQSSTPAVTPENSTGTNSDQIITQRPLISVSVPVQTESFSAADGTEIFRHVYQDMELIVSDPEVADKVIIDFLNRSDSASAAESILESAKKGYIAGSNWTPYLCQITYDPMRIDQGVLSLFGSYATYSGTPHPESAFLSVTYDLLTGDVLSLNNVLSENASGDTICQLVISALNEQKQEKSLFVGFEETVTERFGKDLSLDRDWYFSETGLCFFFSPYEIASYASGVVIAEIPYEKLAGIVNDAYMPAERDSVTGSISADIFTGDSPDNITQFADIKLANGADRLLLTTTTAVQSVRIETGLLSSDGTTFSPSHTVFAASDLTHGNAIFLEANLSDSNQVLRLSYRSGSETIYSIITKN